MNAEVQQFLTQDRRTLAETTGLLKRLYELSISIAEAQQEHIRELKPAHLDFEVAVKEAVLRLEQAVEDFIRGRGCSGHAQADRLTIPEPPRRGDTERLRTQNSELRTS